MHYPPKNTCNLIKGYNVILRTDVNASKKIIIIFLQDLCFVLCKVLLHIHPLFPCRLLPQAGAPMRYKNTFPHFSVSWLLLICLSDLSTRSQKLHSFHLPLTNDFCYQRKAACKFRFLSRLFPTNGS